MKTKTVLISAFALTAALVAMITLYAGKAQAAGNSLKLPVVYGEGASGSPGGGAE